MTVQATVGGAVLGTGIGLGAAGQGAVHPARNVASGPSRVLSQAGGELALTGSSDTMLLLATAFLLVVMGLLLMGLARRHGGLSGALVA